MDLTPAHWVLAVVTAIILHLAALLLVLALWAPNTGAQQGSHSVEVSLSDLGSRPQKAKAMTTKAAKATPTSSATAATSAAPASAQAVANQSPTASSPSPAAAQNAASADIPSTQAQSPVAASQAKQTSTPTNTTKAKHKPAQKTQSHPANPVSNNSTSHLINETTATSQKQQAENRAGSNATNTKDYTAALSQAIAAKKRYPRSARRHNLQGHVEVRVVIQQSGKISNLSIAKSSGHKSLDQAAIKAVRKAAPFGSLPASMQRSQIAIIVPFDFGLTQ